ncbi:hypothetical protein D4R51_03065 [bacterium]|nr:MAG: hypothetical protein D4R51_03065 [bacterium]
MTIIRPIEVKNNIRFLIFFFFTIFIGGIFYVLEYNSFVNARYEASALKKQIADVSTANADLENNLYKMTDPVQLGSLAPKYQLTLERKPQYLNQNQWVSDSSSLH